MSNLAPVFAGVIFWCNHVGQSLMRVRPRRRRVRRNPAALADVLRVRRLSLRRGQSADREQDRFPRVVARRARGAAGAVAVKVESPAGDSILDDCSLSTPPTPERT